MLVYLLFQIIDCFLLFFDCLCLALYGVFKRIKPFTSILSKRGGAQRAERNNAQEPA
jgi:hypothetical protein